MDEPNSVKVSKNSSETLVARFVDFAPYHTRRTRSILKFHPEVRNLFGPNPWSGACLVALVALQLALQLVLAKLLLVAPTARGLCLRRLRDPCHLDSYSRVFSRPRVQE